jgi:hypothetical protein
LVGWANSNAVLALLALVSIDASAAPSTRWAATSSPLTSMTLTVNGRPRVLPLRMPASIAAIASASGTVVWEIWAMSP